MNMKNAIIVGATSGIGLEVARIMRSEGVNIGVAGRREDRLRKFAEEGGNVVWQRIDVTDENAGGLLVDLAERMGGVDTMEYQRLFTYAPQIILYRSSTVWLHLAEAFNRMGYPDAAFAILKDGLTTILLVSGIGSQNRDLDPGIEIATAETNVVGFTRMIDAAFNYLKSHGGGHIGAVSSIAGTKGLGIAPAYSATKRFQNTYIQCLAQLSAMTRANITFTDIRPGFVDTDLLRSGNYPMLMRPEKTARMIVDALRRKKRVATIDWRYRLLVTVWRMIPDCIWERANIQTKQ